MKHECISVFDIFKIGVGPSSSHTLGPWRAAEQFLHKVRQHGMAKVVKVEVLLYGSLAKTGKGHGTDVAILLGLSGEDPVTFDVNAIYSYIEQINKTKKLFLGKEKQIAFDPEHDIQFFFSESLPFHPNAVTFMCQFSNRVAISETYYSIGGGFVVQEGDSGTAADAVELPYPINTAEDLTAACTATGKSIAEVVLMNELAWRTEPQVREKLMGIWHTMRACIYRGCHSTGVLPGDLEVVRRAAGINSSLIKDATYNGYDGWLHAISTGGASFSYTLDWVSCFALAVNEENASFSRVVTAPTNGAAGVVPAVLQYYVAFCDGNREDKIADFLLVAGEIGSIFKKGATLSAAMGGCQAEIGVSAAMAAAGLTQVLGGNPGQCLMAAEIAMEHHLGLTCDPVGGLVQVPCIERNTMGAIKAITAAQLALQSDPRDARISLDTVVKTMWETALDMNHKYKETAEGGLASQVPLSLSEC